MFDLQAVKSHFTANGTLCVTGTGMGDRRDPLREDREQDCGDLQTAVDRTSKCRGAGTRWGDGEGAHKGGPPTGRSGGHAEAFQSVIGGRAFIEIGFDSVCGWAAEQAFMVGSGYASGL